MLSERFLKFVLKANLSLILYYFFRHEFHKFTRINLCKFVKFIANNHRIINHFNLLICGKNSTIVSVFSSNSKKNIRFPHPSKDDVENEY